MDNMISTSEVTLTPNNQSMSVNKKFNKSSIAAPAISMMGYEDLFIKGK